MKADQFKKLGKIMDRWVAVDFVTKKEILDWFGSYNDGMWSGCDEDTHVGAIMDGEWYGDENCTPAIARRAQYLEFSHAEGYCFWISPKCDENALEHAAESTLLWHIECKTQDGEMDETTAQKIAEILGITVEEVLAA